MSTSASPSYPPHKSHKSHKSHNVLITGASQGAGRATALRFAQAGYGVALAARRGDRLEAVAEEVRALGRRAIAIPTDVGEAEPVEALVEGAIATLGPLDVLINNAGICLTGPAEHTTLADWQAILNTNLWGCIHTINALLPHFLERGQGTIVNLGSFGGKMPLPQMTAYCTSKYAVTGLSDTLRLELAPKGIHVATVHPGVINSDFLERAQFRGGSEGEASRRQAQMAETLKGSWVSQPEEIAEAVWRAVAKRQNEVVVGPVAIATEVHRLFPQLTQWALRQATS